MTALRNTAIATLLAGLTTPALADETIVTDLMNTLRGPCEAAQNADETSIIGQLENGEDVQLSYYAGDNSLSNGWTIGIGEEGYDAHLGFEVNLIPQGRMVTCSGQAVGLPPWHNEPANFYPKITELADTFFTEEPVNLQGDIEKGPLIWTDGEMPPSRILKAEVVRSLFYITVTSFVADDPS